MTTKQNRAEDLYPPFTVVAAQAQEVFRSNGYATKTYQASVMGTKVDQGKTSEVKLHFVQESITRLLIDHSIIKRGRLAQVVRCRRLKTTIEDFLEDLSTVAALPVCFLSLKE